MKWVTSEFAFESEVRDSELDVLGVVNNAVYLTYMEHCRHKHLQQYGLDFYALHTEGIDLFVRDCTIKYKEALRSGNCFQVTSVFEYRGKASLHNHQKIIREPDHKVVTTAVFTIIAFDRSMKKIIVPKDIVKQIKWIT